MMIRFASVQIVRSGALKKNTRRHPLVVEVAALRVVRHAPPSRLPRLVNRHARRHVAKS